MRRLIPPLPGSPTNEVKIVLFRAVGHAAHWLRPLEPVLLPGCFRLHVIIDRRNSPHRASSRQLKVMVLNCNSRQVGHAAHRLRPLGPVLLPSCLRLHVIIIHRRVPPDRRAKLAVAAAAGYAPGLDVWRDALMARPIPQRHPAQSQTNYRNELRGIVCLQMHMRCSLSGHMDYILLGDACCRVMYAHAGSSDSRLLSFCSAHSA